MKTQFTPGPWIKCYSPDAIVSGAESSLGTIIVNRQHIAEKNADLIAAAPDLLKCLERAIDIIQNEYPTDQWDDYGMTEMVNAVSKAKGN